MFGIEINVQTGEVKQVALTQEEIDALPPEGLRQSVPQAVSRFKARAALHLAGLLDAAEDLMSAPETPVLAKLAWKDAQEFERNSPTVLSMSAGLGLTEQQLDELFITAEGIKA